MKYTAIIAGATGLIGKYLVNELSNDPSYTEVKVFNRRKVGYTSDKVIEYVVDFSNEATFANKLVGDHVFCALGTTLKKAANLTEYRFVDHELPVLFAKHSATNGAKKYLLVSSVGASEKSKTFYLRTKGEVERDVTAYGTSVSLIFRPSILLGQRNEQRMAETLGKWIMKPLNYLMVGKIRKYRSIKGLTVAKAMVLAAKTNEVSSVIESDAIELMVK